MSANSVTSLMMAAVLATIGGLWDHGAAHAETLPEPPPLDEQRTLDGVGYPVPEPHSHSGYTALTASDDGWVYLGTAYYSSHVLRDGRLGDGARLLRFNVESKQWETLIDAHHLSRYPYKRGLNVQGKFHAEIVIGDDGVVWAATKHGHEDFDNRPEYGESPVGFPGGHLYSFNPHTGEVTDHGILMPQEGMMGGDIDSERRRVYYWSDPKEHFLAYDIDANEVHDFGSLSARPRYTAIDPQGRVFGATRGDRHGHIYMFEPEDERVYDLRIILEGPGEWSPPYVFILSADGQKIFGARHPQGYISELDLTSIEMRDDLEDAHGTIVARHTARAYPGNKRSGVLGADGNFYFANHGHVFRYDPGTREVEDLGQVTLTNHPEWRPYHSQGAAAAPDGTLYLKYLPQGGQGMPYILVELEGVAAPVDE